jgi:hypothetical protein
VYIYHPNYLLAYARNLKSYQPVPDGLIRIKGTHWE